MTKNDIADEMSGSATLCLVKEHRDAVRKGARLIPADKVFERVRRWRKRGGGTYEAR